METRPLGKTGLHTSSLGLGCMGMSEFYGQHNDEESTKTIHRAYELGITFFDTADMYGPYTNEVLVGKAVKDFRKKITLATKFGIIRDPKNPTFRSVNGKPEYVKESCEGSLKRLNTDVIDLYYLHRKDPTVEIEETVGAMADLVKEGKIKAIGLSEVNADTLRRANAVHPVTALQSEYSLWTRDPEKDILKTCEELGIAFVAYSPLGRGFLTGGIKNLEDLDANDFRRNSPRFQGENLSKNLQLVKKIEELARQKGCTTPQLALAWVIAQGDFIFPIPGTKRIKYLEENVAAAKIKFSKNELHDIDEIMMGTEVAGLRYPEAVMKSVNQ